MAAPPLKLQMQEQFPVVCQGHLEYLIDRDCGTRQLALERAGRLHRGAQQPGGKVEHEGADEPFEQTMPFSAIGPLVNAEVGSQRTTQNAQQ